MKKIDNILTNNMYCYNNNIRIKRYKNIVLIRDIIFYKFLFFLNHLLFKYIFL